MSPTLFPSSTVERTSIEILEQLLPHRRSVPGETSPPRSAFAPQLHQISGFVQANSPLLLALPAFPCKSPSPQKVLGPVPDEAERRSLAFLDELCGRISEIYQPGAELVICSDGHVFGDLIGVEDDVIDSYAAELHAMIRAGGHKHLSTFDLHDMLGDLSYTEKRRHITEVHGQPLEVVQDRVRSDENQLRLYRGITRFLVDDTVGFTESRSALQRQCRRRAYGVIQRSAAWGHVVAERFPGSVRLSIHPQAAEQPKFGIRLLDIADMWTTPWHSCLIRHPDGRDELVPHHVAREVGELVYCDGRPDHFVSRQNASVAPIEQRPPGESGAGVATHSDAGPVTDVSIAPPVAPVPTADLPST